MSDYRIYRFENLKVWLKGLDLVVLIYKISESFPKEEKYGLTSQIRRAAVYIVSNLAEGTSRQTQQDQAHFTKISFSSLMEVLNQIIIANKLNYITNKTYEETRITIDEISRMLTALQKAQLR